MHPEYWGLTDLLVIAVGIALLVAGIYWRIRLGQIPKQAQEQLKTPGEQTPTLTF
jgi:hypothetical protein